MLDTAGRFKASNAVVGSHGIKNVNNFFKMDVYANVSVSDWAMKNPQELRTGVSAFGGTKPKWNPNSSLNFRVDYAALIQNLLALKIELVSNRAFSDTKIGEVVISVNELLQNCGQATSTSPTRFQGGEPSVFFTSSALSLRPWPWPRPTHHSLVTPSGQAPGTHNPVLHIHTRCHHSSLILPAATSK
ncbi:hypothetical protein M0R45_025243 [Rubus argutus]|uniref:C2 domain-containing protein n=1 Tax=Rubus argutus TaxID=59490 RepID=A0AAW1WVS6_RUBAR